MNELGLAEAAPVDLPATIVARAFDAAAITLDQFRSDAKNLAPILKAGRLIAESLKAKGRVFSAGNGGSMCDAMHFAEELSGRFRRDRPPLAATAIADPGHLTCVANDFGFDQVFSRYVEAHGRPGDVLVAISTSGRSPNIIKAAQMARRQAMSVIGLTGPRACELAPLCQVHIATPSDSPYADRVQEMHIKCLHILVELVEHHFGWEASPQ